MLSCTFCAHRNPDRSKFCNECGSPLHLAPCEQCAAVNDRAAAACHQCGAPLAATVPIESSLAAPESPPEAGGEDDRERAGAPGVADSADSHAEPVFVAPIAGALADDEDVLAHVSPIAATDVSVNAAAMTPHNSVPTALAERLDARHWLADAAAIASQKPAEADPVLARPFTLGIDTAPFMPGPGEVTQAADTTDLDTVHVVDPVRVVNTVDAVDVDAPRRRPTPAYPRRRRSHAVVLAIAVAAVAGAMAWSAWNPALIDSIPEWLAALVPTRQSAVAPATDTGPREAPSAGVQAPPALVQAPSTSVQTSTTPVQAPPSNEAGPIVAPAASADVLPADRTLASLPPLDDAMPPARLDTVGALDTMPRLMPLDEVVARLPAAKSSRAGDTRSREQAERDALATQRLIARDLADIRRQPR
jgi:hypothetical protein